MRLSEGAVGFGAVYELEAWELEQTEETEEPKGEGDSFGKQFAYEQSRIELEPSELDQRHCESPKKSLNFEGI